MTIVLTVSRTRPFGRDVLKLANMIINKKDDELVEVRIMLNGGRV